MIKLKDLLPINEAKFSKDQIEIMKMAYGTLSGMNPSSPTYKKFIKFLDRLPKDQLKQLAAANIKFVSMLAKNRLRGESVNEAPEHELANKLNKVSDTILMIIKRYEKKADVEGMVNSWMRGLHAKLRKVGVKV